MINAREIVERAAARGAAHQARMTTKAPTSQRLAEPRPILTPEDAVRRMADDMREIAGIEGSVDEDALRNRGWSLESLRKFCTAARDLANRAAVRRA